MSRTSADEVGLFENPKLQNTVEEDGFLRPLHSVEGIEHIGWHNDVNPVFRLSEDRSLDGIGADIVKKIEAGEFNSAGLRAVVLSAGFTIDMWSTDRFSSALLYMHIENWWSSCLPNGLSEREEIQEYIYEEEKMMSERNRRNTSLETIAIDGHADISVTGGSEFGEAYGQYQFIGWK